MARAGGVCVRLVLVSLLLLPAAYHAAGTSAAAVAAAARGPVEGAVRARAPTLRLRGGGDALRAPAVLQKAASKVETLAAEEAKPDLKRHPSRLVLNEGLGANATAAEQKQKVAFRIDGKEVTEEEYKSRVKSVSTRALESWITDSDRGGFKEGIDILVPDHCASIPEAVARVAHDGTVYVRNGTYKWDGVLVVQKHMHIRGEPNPDEGAGYVALPARLRMSSSVMVAGGNPRSAL